MPNSGPAAGARWAPIQGRELTKRVPIAPFMDAEPTLGLDSGTIADLASNAAAADERDHLGSVPLRVTSGRS